MRWQPSDGSLTAAGKVVFFCILGCCLALALRTPAGAQDRMMLPSVPAELRAAYDELLARPADLTAYWLLARDAEMRGFDQFAIRLYERMLILDRRLIQPRLRLAQLHAAAGEPSVARAYLIEALAADELPVEVRRTAQALLAELNGMLSRHRLAGIGRVGLRHATNPAAVSDRLQNIDDDEAQAIRGLRGQKSDQSAYLSLNILHNYDLLRQSEDSLETDFFIYGEKQRQATVADFAVVRLDSGPRLAIGNSVQAMSWRPYALGELVGLENDLFSGEVGGGFDGRASLTGEVVATGAFEATYAWHNNFTLGDLDEPDPTSSSAKNEDRNGPRLRGELGIEAPILRPVSAGIATFAEVVRADADVRKNDALGVRAQLRASFDAPWRLTELPWVAALSGSYRYTRFGSDDSLPKRRTEGRWNVNVTTQIPISRRIGLELRLGHTDVGSSINDADYDNSEVSVGLIFALGP